MTLDRQRRLARRAAAIASCRDLTPRSRLRLAQVALSHRRPSTKPVRLDVGPGSVTLAGSQLVFDYTAFYEIFVSHQYGADFRGRTVIDLGAHRGYFSAFALLRGAASVRSYEPEATNFGYLDETRGEFVASGHEWTAECCAVGGADGEATLHVTPRSWSHSLLPRPDVGVLETRAVQVRSMASIVADALGEARPVMVKMDVEGAECDIVLGTPVEVWQEVAELYVEFENRGPCDWLGLEQHLGAAGLSVAHRAGRVVHLDRSRS